VGGEVSVFYYRFEWRGVPAGGKKSPGDFRPFRGEGCCQIKKFSNFSLGGGFLFVIGWGPKRGGLRPMFFLFCSKNFQISQKKPLAATPRGNFFSSKHVPLGPPHFLEGGRFSFLFVIFSGGFFSRRGGKNFFFFSGFLGGGDFKQEGRFFAFFFFAFFLCFFPAGGKWGLGGGFLGVLPNYKIFGFSGDQKRELG